MYVPVLYYCAASWRMSVTTMSSIGRHVKTVSRTGV